MNCKSLNSEYRYLSNNSFGAVSAWRLRPEIPLPSLKSGDKLKWQFLSGNSNPGAFELLLENPIRIYFDFLSFNSNPKALNYLLNEHPGKINWNNLAENESPHAVNAVINHGNIFYDSFLQNESDTAVNYLLNNDFIRTLPNPYHFSRNSNPRAVDFLLRNPEYININYLCANSNDLMVDRILQLPLNQIVWPLLSKNTNRRIVEFLTKRHPDKINSWDFSQNKSPYALKWLLAHRQYMNLYTVYFNEQIFIKNRWNTVIKPAVKMLSAHHRAIISANHPNRKRQRGEFDEDFD